MQQEKNDLQKKLIRAEELIKSQEQLIDALSLSAEISQEILAYHLPHVSHDPIWKRVYLPIYGEIKSPPFSKN